MNPNQLRQNETETKKTVRDRIAAGELRWLANAPSIHIDSVDSPRQEETMGLVSILDNTYGRDNVVLDEPKYDAPYPDGAEDVQGVYVDAEAFAKHQAESAK